MSTEAVDNLVAVMQQVVLLLWVTLGLLAILVIVYSVSFAWVIRAAKINVGNLETRAFKEEAMGLLEKGEYQGLIEISRLREQRTPGDSLAPYYLAMAHYRSGNYVEAKRYFLVLPKLEATWKQISERHLAEIEVALKNSKPKLVEDAR